MEAWPLVGRDGSLLALDEAVRERKSVVVFGATGCGKSRLVRSHVAARDDAVIAVTSTVAASSIPLGAFASVLPAGLPLDPLGRLRAAVGHLAVTASALVVDDAHLLDPAGATLLLELASKQRVQVIATVRSGQPAPDAVVALWKDGHARRLELAALDEAHTLELARRVLGGALSDHAASVLWERTEGNPLALRELLASAQEAGALASEAGVWHVAAELPVPAALRDLVRGRIEGLDEPEREALELIALADPAPIGLVTELGLVDACEALEARGLIRSQGEGGRILVRPEHPLHGEAIREALPHLRRRRHVERLASLAQQLVTVDPVRAAMWQLEAEVAYDPALLRTASELARSMDPMLGERLARAALAVSEDGDGYAVLAESLVLLGRIAEAETLLDRGEAVARTDAELARLAVAATQWVGLAGGDYAAALRRAMRLRTRLRDEEATSRVDTGMALVAAMTGELAVADDASGRVLARSDASAEAVATAYGVRTLVRAVQGQTVGLAEMLDLAEAQARTLTDPLHLHHLTANRITLLTVDGRMSDALDLAREQVLAASRRGDQAFAGVFGVWYATTLEAAGFVQQAAVVLRDAARSVDRSDPFSIRQFVACLRSLVAAQLGDAQVAEAALAPVPAGTADVRLRVWGTRARAWSSAMAGEVDAAVAMLVAEAWAVEQCRAPVWAASLLYDAVRLGRATDVAERLVALGAQGSNPDGILALMAEHAQADAIGDADGLERAADRLGGAGLLLRAAEASARAARVCTATADPIRAARATVRAEVWLQRCPGARTPAVAGLIPALSERERQIAELAVKASSRHVAERLVLSVRTVDNHLARIYRRLGVSGRTELAALLAPPGTESPLDIASASSRIASTPEPAAASNPSSPGARM